jgi:hypothetical protein
MSCDFLIIVISQSYIPSFDLLDKILSSFDTSRNLNILVSKRILNGSIPRARDIIDGRIVTYSRIEVVVKAKSSLFSAMYKFKRKCNVKNRAKIKNPSLEFIKGYGILPPSCLLLLLVNRFPVLHFLDCQ